MKELIALVCFVTTNALAAPLTLSPSDIVSLVINGVRFSFSEIVPEEIVVNSTGTGNTKEEAVNNALVTAVQKGIGVLVVTDLNVENDKVVKNLALMYSSGVVNHYDIKKCNENFKNKIIECDIEAKVSPWAFRNKLLADSNTVKVDGENLFAEYFTSQYVSQQRKQMLEYYLSQIRISGLETKIEQIKVLSGPEIEINYSIFWNENFKKDMIKFFDKLEKDTRANEKQHNVKIIWSNNLFYWKQHFFNIENNNKNETYSYYLNKKYFSPPIYVYFKELNYCHEVNINSKLFYMSITPLKEKTSIKIDMNKIRDLRSITSEIGCKI